MIQKKCRPYERRHCRIYISHSYHTQPKNADKTLFFVKEKPKPNTLVFDLGFDWRRNRDLNPGYASHVLLP